MKQISFLFLIVFMSLTCGFAQQMTEVPFTSDHWDLSNAEVMAETYMGRESLRIDSGRITVNDLQFLNGTIEAAINFSAARAFPEVLFRVQDDANFENIYVRPHQSGNPDALQYTPVFNGLAGWQLYQGEGYTQALELEPDTWHHIKIDISGEQADYYFNDMTTPVMQLMDLKHETVAGLIGLGTDTPVHYANFRYSVETPELTPRNMNAGGASDLPGLVRNWSVSNILRDDLFGEMLTIDDEFAGSLEWQRVQSEPSGVVNLARYARRQEGMNTVVAKIEFTSESEGGTVLNFGFSDYVQIYVNGQVVYAGADEFNSRDFRFLGTIGFYDYIYVPLMEGENEIWLVTTENFGGWGVQARFLMTRGLSF